MAGFQVLVETCGLEREHPGTKIKQRQVAMMDFRRTNVTTGVPIFLYSRSAIMGQLHALEALA